MKQLTLFFLLLSLLSIPAAAQVAIGTPAVESSIQKGEEPVSYPMPAPYSLHEDFKKTDAFLKAYIKAHPESQKLKKTSAWGFTEGQAQSWWATDLNTASGTYYTEYSVPTHCRVVGSNCYIFVEDSLWTNGTVTPAAVSSIQTAFETSTPGDNTKGIFQLDTTYFGTPPDCDNDPKIIILILNIRDGYNGSGGYIGGYFYSINEYTEEQVLAAYPAGNRHSNEAEIFYIDANPANLRTSYGVEGAASTTAHEFQHMLNWGADGNEETFVNEGMSETASVLCGYGLRSPSLYYENTNVDFLSWNLSGDVLSDYSRTALFSWYLIEQFGSSLTKQIVQDPANGVTSYNNAFDAVGSMLQFNDVLKNFAVATSLNDLTVDAQYGFTYPVSGAPSTEMHYTPNVPLTNGTVQPYGTKYIEFSSGESLTFTFTTSGSLEVKAIATGSSPTRVDYIASGTPYTLSDFGTNYSNVVIAITELVGTTTAYSYTASGAGGSSVIELKYDLSEPTGYLSGADGDTVCVWFDGVANAKLDSVRVALRRAGTMTGGVWRYTGAIRPTPIGAPLAVPINATVTQTPGVPYPVPWPNWATIDLRSYDIDASNPFAVAFVDQGAGSTQPRVMITESPLTEVTSLTYYDGSSGYNWYYFTSNSAGDSVFTYLIRAYVTLNTTDVEQNIELKPHSFVLDQNYPNPFNPLTNIKFSIPSREFVTLKVYDMMGREIATLENGMKEAGSYTIPWNANHLSSGVYWYRLTAGKFLQTNKMLLMK